MKTINFILTVLFIIGLLTIILTPFKLFGCFLTGYMMVAGFAVRVCIFINSNLQ